MGKSFSKARLCIFLEEDLHMLRSGLTSLCGVRLSGSCSLYPHYHADMFRAGSENVMCKHLTSHTHTHTHTHSHTLNVKIKLLGQQHSWTVFTTEHPEADFLQFRLLNTHNVSSNVTCKGALESILLHTSQGGNVYSHIYSTSRQYNICSVSSVQQQEHSLRCAFKGDVF